jgi:hypothetical protein
MEDSVRVYLINVEEVDLKEEHIGEMSDQRFSEIALEVGSVYDLEGFVVAYNQDTVSSSKTYIRIF